MSKQVFITGGAGGLGGVTSKLLAAQGWHVFVADFDQQLLAEYSDQPCFTPIPIDVTNPESVTEALHKVKQSTDQLDAVINFAGILAIGSLIELDEADLKRVLEVNVMGTFRVNKAFFPLVEKAKGRIVNISSETGWQSGAPFNGAYAMSKHAIEAYSDSLRRELALYDIPVIKIQPGPFKTNMVDGMQRVFEQAANTSTRFGNVLKKMIPYVIKEAQHANDPAILANTVYVALTTESPKAAYSVKPARSRVLMEKLPTRMADMAFKSMLKKAL